MPVPLDEYMENYMEVFGRKPDNWRWAECGEGNWNTSRVGASSQHMLFDGPQEACHSVDLPRCYICFKEIKCDCAAK